MDKLKDALRPLPCKWAGCSATLASWRRLYQHYKKVHLSPKPHKVYECHIKENQNGRPCNTGFESYEGLWEHLKVVHLNKLLYKCPFKACKMNLKRSENDLNDIQNHLDEHQGFGERISLAAHKALPTTQLPLLPEGEQLSYKLIAQSFTPKHSSPNAILKARRKVVHNSYENEYLLFGPLLTHDWLEEEESTETSSIKERKIKLTGPPGKKVPSKVVPKLETPPLFLAPPPPRHPIVSVGFNSPGFHKKAKVAFQRAEEDVDMDDV